ncbi:MAG: MoxR family ATPase, partial [Oscillospiraceae bacterium]|nr:MoxR family ATPase [Oscillospiraceae bacterium]
VLDASLEAFYRLRALSGIQKKPATSELVDWIRALTLSGIPVEKITSDLPFAGVLLKKNEDLDTLERSRRSGFRR